MVVYWNKVNISHYFREEQMQNQVTLSWETASGQKLEINVHAKPQESRPQYDFLVDGVSIFRMPRYSELPRVEEDDSSSVLSDLSDTKDRTETTVDENQPPAHEEDEERSMQDMEFRLSIAGLSPHTEKALNSDDLEDELTSDVLTHNLESLRCRVASLITGTDDLVSLAIIKTLSDNHDSYSTCSSCSDESMGPAAMHIEAEAIWETLHWLELNRDSEAQSVLEDKKRALMQKHINKVFMHVRRDQLSVDAATRILCCVATFLGFRLKVPARNDLVVLSRMNKYVEDSVLMTVLASFGEVVGFAVLRRRNFAVCRFRSEESVGRFLGAVNEGNFLIAGERPRVSVLEQPPAQRPEICTRSFSAPSTTVEKPALVRKRSHQRNTITIDTAIGAAPFLMVENNEHLLDPDEMASFQRPSTFSSMRAKSSPSVYNRPIVSP